MWRPSLAEVRMKIINLITRLNIGGASGPVIALAAGLRNRGHESLLVVGVPQAAEGCMDREAVQAGADLLRIQELRRNPNPHKDLMAFAKLGRLFRRFRPDVVVTHMTKAGLLGRLAARAIGVPVIVHTYHGQGFQVFREHWKERFVLNVERCLARLSTGSIVVSEVQLQKFIQWRIGRPGSLRVIRYGLDLEPYLDSTTPRTLRQDLGLPVGAQLVGVIGRLVAIKGQDIFIEAAASLVDRYPAAFFLLVGDGEYRSAYESLAAKLGIDKRVKFLGWRRDIPFVLANLDVAVLPTVLDFEGTPLAVIEALAAGRAVVATSVGSVPEVVRNGETGLLVSPSDPGGLANAIAALLDDPRWAGELGRRGRELASKHYRRERMITEAERYFGECLEAGASRRA